MSTHLLTFVTARSQYARVQTVLQRLEQDERFDLEIVLAGGGLVHDYGDLRETMTSDGLTVDHQVHSLLEGGEPITQSKTTGLSLIEFSGVIRESNPDAVITTGDRYETMATTIAASFMNTPVVHLEGGEATGSIDDKVRHATTKMADYHLVSTSRSGEIVRELGEPLERIVQTGCPSTDLCKELVDSADGPYDPQEHHSGVGGEIDVSEPYLLVQYHPLPTEYERMYDRTWELIEAIEAVKYQAFWFWPNMDAGTDRVAKAIREYRERYNPDHVHFYINLPPEDYLSIARDAACVVGNSSVGIREASYFGTPTVNIGARQVFRERGENVVDVEPDRSKIEDAVHQQVEHGPYESSFIYEDGAATTAITEFLATTNFSLKDPMSPTQLLPNLDVSLPSQE
jgi:UDP-hydrolysing UDP-N-acetyl-D-glucosamine 2-epimerase